MARERTLTTGGTVVRRLSAKTHHLHSRPAVPRPLVPSKKESTGQANCLLPTGGSSTPAWFEVPAGVFARPKHKVEDDLNTVGRASVASARYMRYEWPETNHELRGRRQSEWLLEH